MDRVPHRRRRIYRIADNFLAFYLDVLTGYRTESKRDSVGPFWTAGGRNEIDVVALAGRARIPVMAGEATWAREISAPRVVADLYRKAAALPGAPHTLRIAVCAREQVINLPDDVTAITVADIFP